MCLFTAKKLPNWVVDFSSPIYPEIMSEENSKELSCGPEQEAGAQRLKLVEDKRLRLSNFKKKWGCLLVIQLGRFLHVYGSVRRITSLFTFHY